MDFNLVCFGVGFFLLTVTDLFIDAQNVLYLTCGSPLSLVYECFWYKKSLDHFVFFLSQMSPHVCTFIYITFSSLLINYVVHLPAELLEPNSKN